MLKLLLTKLPQISLFLVKTEYVFDYYRLMGLCAQNPSVCRLVVSCSGGILTATSYKIVKDRRARNLNGPPGMNCCYKIKSKLGDRK